MADIVLACRAMLAGEVKKRVRPSWQLFGVQTQNYSRNQSEGVVRLSGLA
jgi:hypothetical protein